MNVPGLAQGNWSWRYAPGVLTGDLTEQLKLVTAAFGRSPRFTKNKPVTTRG